MICEKLFEQIEEKQKSDPNIQLEVNKKRQIETFLILNKHFIIKRLNFQ
jgi:hypothetical protein